MINLFNLFKKDIKGKDTLNLLAKNNIRKVFIIAVIVIVVIIGLVIYFLFFFDKSSESLSEETFIEIPTPEEAGAGSVGEVIVKNNQTGEEKPLMTPETPSKIYNTTGIVIGKETNYLSVRGSGKNFADQLPRALIVYVDDSTLIYGNGIPLNLKGKDGLQYLESGDSILIEGDGNIRGKDRFNAVRIEKTNN